MNINFETINECRISNSKDLTKVLDLGLQPLANSLKKNQFDNEDKYPLTLSFCKKSSLLQLNETIKKGLINRRKIAKLEYLRFKIKNYFNNFFQ